jgi:hypothetical protein
LVFLGNLDSQDLWELADRVVSLVPVERRESKDSEESMEKEDDPVRMEYLVKMVEMVKREKEVP